MKKVPFDLTLAKQGVDVYYHQNNQPCKYIADFNGAVWLHTVNKYGETLDMVEKDMSTWYHLIPKEPVKERWGVVNKHMIFDSKAKAEDKESNYIDFIVVKLAE